MTASPNALVRWESALCPLIYHVLKLNNSERQGWDRPAHPLRVGDARFELDFSIYHSQTRESYPRHRCQRNRRKGCICCNVSKARKQVKMFKEELSLRKKLRIVPPFAPPWNIYYLWEMRQMAQPLQALASSAWEEMGWAFRSLQPQSVSITVAFSGCESGSQVPTWPRKMGGSTFLPNVCIWNTPPLEVGTLLMFIFLRWGWLPLLLSPGDCADYRQ